MKKKLTPVCVDIRYVAWNSVRRRFKISIGYFSDRFEDDSLVDSIWYYLRGYLTDHM